MNINKINDFIKSIGLFLLSKIAAILLLTGLAIVVYGFFRISTNAGVFALGIAVTIISLITAWEGGGNV